MVSRSILVASFNQSDTEIYIKYLKETGNFGGSWEGQFFDGVD